MAVYTLLGFAGVVVAGMLSLVGVMRSGRAPAHQADVEGLRALADELRIDRDDLRVQLAECRRENMHLRHQLAGGDDA